MKNLRKYLIFLDIDGVFASSRVHYAHGAQYEIWHRFDPIAIDFMNKIHDRYPVEFVLMSTWKDTLRNDDTVIEHWIRSAFANAGFRGMFALPWKTDPDNFAVLKKWHRGDEVKDYLENFGTDIIDFVLFDDNKHNFDKILPKNRLVLTDSENGLLYKHMKNAMSIIGQWDKK